MNPVTLLKVRSICAVTLLRNRKNPDFDGISIQRCYIQGVLSSMTVKAYLKDASFDRYFNGKSCGIDRSGQPYIYIGIFANIHFNGAIEKSVMLHDNGMYDFENSDRYMYDHNGKKYLM